MEPLHRPKEIISSSVNSVKPGHKALDLQLVQLVIARNEQTDEVALGVLTRERFTVDDSGCSKIPPAR